MSNAIKALRTKFKIDTMDNARRYHKGHWFNESTMKFFKSRVPDFVYLDGDRFLFISSEKGPMENSTRKYTIRAISKNTGSVNTIGEFQEYATKRQAEIALYNMLTQPKGEEC